METALRKQLETDYKMLVDFPEHYSMEAPQAKQEQETQIIKQCPEDNDPYVKNCKNGRSPKETRWWFHDDKV
ncbi:hypothetical protein Leryth_008209 [Lithospermum erythrorhizon]|nr:hypothetical protein Leryth_008209 [Lithospermum erythrorhizon]